jgi:hypothetical protein
MFIFFICLVAVAVVVVSGVVTSKKIDRMR